MKANTSGSTARDSQIVSIATTEKVVVSKKRYKRHAKHKGSQSE
jgi:hypothetical protein